MQKGLKFTGSIRQPTGASMETHHDYNTYNNYNDYSAPAATNPLEDIRMSGDPLEINSGLMGITQKTPRYNNNNKKPVPVSLMLDIYPMHDDNKNNKPPHPPSPPKRKLKRRPPSTSYSQFSSGYNSHSNEPHYNRIPPTTVETIHSPGQYYHHSSIYPSDHSEHSQYSTYPHSLYHPSASGHLTRDHVAKPSHVHEIRRPFSGAASQEDSSKSEAHQIMLHLNFYPKKKTRGSNLYER